MVFEEFLFFEGLRIGGRGGSEGIVVLVLNCGGVG